jgi:predicted RNA-binding Zn-ribbon protein involved in translation (DUF1610 family)
MISKKKKGSDGCNVAVGKKIFFLPRRSRHRTLASHTHIATKKREQKTMTSGVWSDAKQAKIEEKTKLDWHAIAKKEWAGARAAEKAENKEEGKSRYRAAAAAWTWALAGVRVTRKPGMELERMLYLRNRSKAYMKTGQYTLALDDIEWVLRLQGVWNGSGIDVQIQDRHAYFVKCIAAYAAELERLRCTDGTFPMTESWLQSTAYITTSKVFDELFCRTLDDLEHFAIALERFDSARAAALVYKLLAGIDKRPWEGASDSRARWTGRMMQTSIGAMAAEQKEKEDAKKENVPTRLVRNQPHQLSATQQETLKSMQDPMCRLIALEDIREVWHDWNVAARRYADGVGDNEITHTADSTLWRVEYHTDVETPTITTDTTTSGGGGGGDGGGDGGRREFKQKKKKKATMSTTMASVTKVVGHIECRWTSAYGRAVYATQGFAKGDIVWIESPDSAATVDVEACVHCARHVSPKARVEYQCVNCGDATVYCSRGCRTQDAVIHGALCGMDMREWQTSVAEHAVSTSSRNPFVIMRMLARRVTDSSVMSVSSSTSSSSSSSCSIPSLSSSSSSSSRLVTKEKGYTFPPVYAATDLWTSGWLHTLRSTPNEGGIMRDRAYDIYNRNRDRFAGHSLMHPQVYNFANFHTCTGITITFGFSFDTAALNDLTIQQPPVSGESAAAKESKSATKSSATKRKKTSSVSSSTPSSSSTSTSASGSSASTSASGSSASTSASESSSRDDSASRADEKDVSLPFSESVVKKEKARARPRNRVSSGIGVYNVGANFNHSCDPNVTWMHPPEEDDMPRNTIVFAATRDIAKGEQLFITYINVNQSFEDRKIALTTYQFQCRCPKCLLKI